MAAGTSATDTLRQFQLMGVRDTGKKVGDGSYATVRELDFCGLKCVGKRLHAILYNSASPQEKEALLERFAAECELLSRLHHPCIVQFLGVYFEPGSQLPVMVMEYLHTTLSACLADKGILPEKISYEILRDVILGLRYLHEHPPPIIHRDLSANNVLLTPNMSAKISDLGVAKIVNLSPAQMGQMTQTQTPGTPCYMPPETMISRPKYTNKVDIFSYGVMMVHMLSGQWPIPGEAFQEDPDNPDSNIPVSEFDRRTEFLQKIHQDHPLMGLIRQCLNNVQARRPEAVEVHERISTALAERSPSSPNQSELPQLINSLSRQGDTEVDTVTTPLCHEIDSLRVQAESLSIRKGESLHAGVKHQLPHYRDSMDENQPYSVKKVFSQHLHRESPPTPWASEEKPKHRSPLEYYSTPDYLPQRSSPFFAASDSTAVDKDKGKKKLFRRKTPTQARVSSSPTANGSPFVLRSGFTGSKDRFSTKSKRRGLFHKKEPVYRDTREQEKKTQRPGIPLAAAGGYGMVASSQAHQESPFMIREAGLSGGRVATEERRRYFGSPLESVVGVDGIPVFVKKCVELVELVGMKTVEIYRLGVPGRKDDCLVLQQEFDEDNNLDIASLGLGVRAVCGTLKAYFKLLPDPLISASIATNLLVLDVTSLQEEAEKVKMHKVLADMPESNLKTLRYLVLHLNRVSEYYEHNRMTATKLAIVFWPILMRPPLVDLADLADSRKRWGWQQLGWQLVMTRLIECPDYIP